MTPRERWLANMGRWDTCYHEAGHALLMRFFEIGVRRVEVYKWATKTRLSDTTFYGAKLNGVTHMYRPQSGSVLKLASILYAGCLAEERLRKDRYPDRDYHIRGADKREVQRLLSELPKGQADYIRRNVRRMTREILFGGWSGVRTVARHLYRHGRILGTAQLDRLLEKDKVWRKHFHERKTQKRRSPTRPRPWFANVRRHAAR